MLAAQGLRSLAHRLSCSAAYGVFPDQGSNLCALQGGFFTTGPPSKPKERFIRRFRPLKTLLGWQTRAGCKDSTSWSFSSYHLGKQLNKIRNSESETCSVPVDPSQDRGMNYSSRFHALSSPLSLHNSFPEQNVAWRRLKICIIIITVKL